MNGQEIANAVAMLNAFWSRQPLEGATAKIWGMELQPFDAARTMAAIRGLARSSKWRPSLAEIIEAIEGPKGLDASSAMTKVLSVVMIHPPGQRDDKVPPEVLEAVRRLGGWRTVGTWQKSERQWREKDFARVLGEVQESNNARALPGAQRKELSA